MIGDGRVRLIMIEPAGREALLELDVHASEMRDRIFGDIPQADLETAQRVLDTLAARLAVHPGLAAKPS